MNIIITGASNGIGFETASHFAKDTNNKVICISRNTFPGSLPNVISLPFDFEKGNISDELIPKIKKHCSHVDVLINNAALLIKKPFADLSDGDWARVFQVNFFSPVKLVRALIPFLEKSSSPHVVNISSMGGYQGSVKFPELAAYSASKAALSNLTESLAVELDEKNIKVNCLCIGGVQTKMFETAFPGMKADVSPQTMGDYVHWFSSNAHKTMNGKVMAVSLSTP